MAPQTVLHAWFASTAFLLAGSSLADVIVVSPSESIQDAIDASQDGDVIELEAGDFVLPAGVSLETRFREVLIRGTRGPDGEWLSRIFSRDATAIEHNGGSGKALEIEDVAFTGTIDPGEAPPSVGVAITMVNGYGVVRGCLFEACEGLAQNGGAIYVSGGSPVHRIDFEDCTFRECEGRLGGAIYHRMLSSQTTAARWPVVRCRFEYNSASDNAGAGAIYTSNYGAGVVDSIFVENRVSDPGSPVGRSIMSHQLNPSTIEGSSFCSEFADDAGVVHVAPTSSVGSGFNCLANSCVDSDGDDRPDGCDQCDGVVDVDADGSGWADCHERVDDLGRRVLTVAGGTPIQPAIDAAQDGDVIELEAGDFVLPAGVSLETRFREVLIRGTRGPDGEWLSRIFSRDATAIEHNGGSGKALEIEDVAFTGTIDPGEAPPSVGVAITMVNGYGEVRGCLFEACEGLAQNGGAIYVSGGSPVQRIDFEDCTFRNCRGRFGGAIYHRSLSSQTTTARWPVVRCRFEYNSASDNAGAGAIYTSNYGAGVVDSIFVENRASDPGSPVGRSIMSHQLNPSTIEGSSFCSEFADDAGVVHVAPTSSVGSGFNCLANSCVDSDGDDRPDGCDQCDGVVDVDADGSGWADCHERVDDLGRRVLTVAGGTPIQPAIDAAQDGDVIELEAGDFVLPAGVSLETRVREVLIRGTRGPDGEWLSRIFSRDATAIEHNGGSGKALEIEDVAFTGTIDPGEAPPSVGVAITMVNGYGVVRGCLFEACEGLAQNGGAIYVSGGSPVHRIDFEDCTFRECEGRLGGAIYHRMLSSQTTAARWPVVRCRFEYNSASDNAGAGAIYTSNYGAGVVDSIFVENRASDPGSPVGRSIMSHQLNPSTIEGSSFCSEFADDAGVVHVAPTSSVGSGFNCLANSCVDSDGDDRPDGCDQCDGVVDVDADGSGWADCHERVDDLGRRVLTVAGGTPIQPAIDAAQDGDVIELEAGDFVLPAGVSLETRFREVLIRGTRGPDGEWLSRIFSRDATAIEHNGGSGKALEIEDVAFTGTIDPGEAPSSVGVAITMVNGYGVVRGCLFEACEGLAQNGGAIYVSGGSPVHRIDFEDCTFRDCEGRLGGAIFHRTANSQSSNGRWDVVGCRFEGNQASDPGGAGAIYTNRLGVAIEDGSFVRNIVSAAPLPAIAVATDEVASDVSNTAFCADFGDGVLGSFVTDGVVDGGGVCVTMDCTDVDENGVPDVCDPVLCPGDLNGDEIVDAADLGLLIGDWSRTDSDADLNDDGVVDAADLGLLIGAWGLCG